MQNQLAAFDRIKASLNRGWQNKSSVAAHSCSWFVPIKWKLNRTVFVKQHLIYYVDRCNIMENEQRINERSLFVV